MFRAKQLGAGLMFAALRAAWDAFGVLIARNIAAGEASSRRRRKGAPPTPLFSKVI
ncbi:MAG: hypothetical protein MPL62_07565 [Alphaproteobacteria bacterium]|nr:hypothetical protein [Alphaproteobacteria bacterium]